MILKIKGIQTPTITNLMPEVITQKPTSIKEVHKLHGSLCSRLFNEPLSISSEAIPQLLMSLADDKVGESMAAHCRSQESPKGEYVVTSDRWGNSLPQPTKSDGFAFIPIMGPIAKSVGNLGKWYGMSDMNDVREWLNASAQDPEVKAIILIVDSPGGFTTGVQEVASLVAKIATNIKPVMAFTEGTMASAAYWIGGASTFVYGTPSCSVGSIGSYITIADASKFYERMGVKIHVFRSGEYKGLGVDGVTSKQADYLNERVQQNAAQFKSFIGSRRTLIKDQDMQGQSYFGSEAAAKGFLGAVVDDLEDAVALFKGHLT